MSKYEGLPDMHDRVTEAYFGGMGEEFAQSTRERVHWICTQVIGERVLDVGCSQGITAILLGREGKFVTGIDVNETVVAQAQAYLAEEVDAVRKRVTFLQGDFLKDNVWEGSFDTIIMAEVLEHLIYPNALIAAAAERVKPGGKLIVTVPFGVNDWPDHKHTFYMYEPWRLISAFFDVEDIMYFGKWIGFVARRRIDDVKVEDSLPAPESIADLETAFQKLERGLFAQLSRLNERLRIANGGLIEAKEVGKKIKEEKILLRMEISELRTAFEAEQVRRAEQEKAEAAAEAAKGELANSVGELSVRVKGLEEDNLRLINENEFLKAELEHRDQQISDLKNQITQISNKANIIEQQVRHIEREKEGLVSRLALVEHQKQVAETKIEQTKQTLSFRLGRALIFGFKSWSGFRALPKELLAVQAEGKRRRLKKKVLTSGKPSGTVQNFSGTMPLRGEIYNFSNRNKVQVKVPQPTVTKRPDELRVAMVVDEFTYNSFSPEFEAVVVEPESWQERFEQAKPDIFFCESAWSGVDTQRRPWKGRVYASENFKKENRGELLDILAHCRREGIPTVFWNKEDPAHYTDRVHDFVKTAREFDHVFTSAAECVSKYKNDYGLDRVYSLPFATNPSLFNPVEEEERSASVVFAGSWYANHVQRSSDMENILDRLVAEGFPVEIYDRYYGDGDPLHKWPEKYGKFIKPGLPHEQMARVYKSSRYGLNFNTVSTSETMFARRVFELISSNTLVLSNYSKGVDSLFGNNVVFVDKEPERLKALSQPEVDLMRENALREVLKNHTYSRRWMQILSDIGLPYRVAEATLTYAIIIHSEEDAGAALTWFQQYAHAPHTRLLLVASLNIPDIELPIFYQKFNRFGVTVTSVSHAKKHALDGFYSPIETASFVMAELDNVPALSWIEEASLHLQYMSRYAISPGNGKEQKYRILKSMKGNPVFGKREIFPEYIRNWSDSGLVYYL